MPSGDRRTISIPEEVYLDAKEAKDEHGLTWADLIAEGVDVVRGEGGVPPVRVVEIEPGPLKEMSGKVAREMKEELQGGPY